MASLLSSTTILVQAWILVAMVIAAKGQKIMDPKLSNFSSSLELDQVVQHCLEVDNFENRRHQDGHGFSSPEDDKLAYFWRRTRCYRQKLEQIYSKKEGRTLEHQLLQAHQACKKAKEYVFAAKRSRESGQTDKFETLLHLAEDKLDNVDLSIRYLDYLTKDCNEPDNGKATVNSSSIPETEIEIVIPGIVVFAALVATFFLCIKKYFDSCCVTCDSLNCKVRDILKTTEELKKHGHETYGQREAREREEIREKARAAIAKNEC